VNLRDEENPVEANIEQEMDKPRRTMTANGARQWRRGALLGGGRRWGPGEAGGDPGRRGFRAVARAQGGGGGSSVCECVGVGGRVCASGGCGRW